MYNTDVTFLRCWKFKSEKVGDKNKHSIVFKFNLL